MPLTDPVTLPPTASIAAAISERETFDRSTARRAGPFEVFVLGASGTAGRAAVRALLAAGHRVTCLVRAGADGLDGVRRAAGLPAEAVLRAGDVTDPRSLRRDGFRGERFDALVSCLASRTGAPADAWAIDRDAHLHALAAALEAGVRHVVLLSAI